MKQIKALNKTISERQTELDRLDAEVNRAESAIRAVDEAEAAVVDARQRRDTEAAEAFLAKRDATPEFHAELDRAEQQATSLRSSGNAARTALEIIGTRANELRAEMGELIGKRRTLIAEKLAAKREAAIDRYVEAVNALGPVVAEVVAADRLIRRISEPGTVRQLPGESLFSRIRMERVCIPWDRSGREQPIGRSAHAMLPGVWEAVSQYVDHVPVLASPQWMDDDSLIDAAVESAAGELRAAGLEI